MIAQREERKNSLLEKISRDHGHIARYERERDTMHRLIISKAKSIVEKNLERGEPNTIKNASRINYKTPNLEWHLHLLGIPHDAIAGSYRNITAYNDDIAAAKQRIIDHTKGVGDVEKEIEEIKSKTISEEEYNSLIRSRNRLLSFDVEEIFAESFAQALGEWNKEIAELKSQYGENNVIVVEGLLNLHIVVALVDRQGDQVLRHRADFLGASQGGFDAAVPDQIGHLVTKQRLALSGIAAAEFTLSHVFFLLFQPASCKYGSSRNSLRRLTAYAGRRPHSCRAHISLRRDLSEPFRAVLV